MLLGLLLGTLLAACAGEPVPQIATIAATPPPVFTLGPGDRLRVTVFDQDELNGEYAVGPNGQLSLPLIGNIEARGRTVPDVQGDIRARLANGFLLDPQVGLDVLSYRPFYILGEVSRPGQYPYSDALSVVQAVAVAGGYTSRANTRRAYIRRAGEEVERAYPLNASVPIWVLPGDTIRIGERYF